MSACRLLSALLTIFLLTGAFAAPALADYQSVLSEEVSDGRTVQANGCFVSFSITNGSLAAHVSSPDHAAEDAHVPAGQSYYYYNLLRIYVQSVNGNRATVSIDKFVSNSSAASGTKVSCDTPGQTALGGDVVSFPITIENNDPSDHTYTLSSYNDVNWKTWFEYGKKGVYQISVPSNQSRTVDLMVQTLGSTGVGKKNVWGHVDKVRFDVSVDITSANKSAEVSAKVSSAIAYIGDKITYDLGIKNLKSDEGVFTLAVTGLPQNWYGRFKETAASPGEIAKAVVPGSSEKSIVLEIVPPYSVTPGNYGFTAVVTGPDGLGISKNLTLTLKSGGGMTVTAPKLSYNTKPGQAFTVDLYVSNSGQGTALTNVYVDTEAPDGWIIQSSPNRTNSIKPGGSQTFTLTVTPPGNIVASDYEVNAKVRSDQSMVEKDYRIQVTTDSYIPYIGFGIIALVLIGLVAVYMKFGRR